MEEKPLVGELSRRDIDPLVVQFESAIQAGASEQHLANARSALRKFLLLQAQLFDGGSIGDAVAVLALNARKNQAAAAILLRAIAIPGVIPPANEANDLDRNIVLLAETALPALCSYLKLAEKRQTYQKYALLLDAHDQAIRILQPLVDSASDYSSFIAQRQPILQCLHSSYIRSYCAPFGLSEYRRYVNLVFERFRKFDLSKETIGVESRV